jgi:hypothetical protein
MKKILKWSLRASIPEGIEHGTRFTVDAPSSAQILSVQVGVAEQHGEPMAWVLIDPAAATVTRTFCVYFTGRNMPDNPGVFVATFQPHSGVAVHLFEIV